MRQKKMIIGFGVLLFVALFSLKADSSYAATINVAAGPDGLNPDSTCTLSEAIYNINNQDNSTYSECAAGDGNEDTIILPNDTITVSAQPEQIAADMIIQGWGMQNSIINLNGQIGFEAPGGGYQVTLQGFTILNPESWAARFDAGDGSYEFLDLEITSNGTGEVTGGVIVIEGDIVANGLYIHHLTGGQSSNAYILELDGNQGGQGLIENSTIAHVQETAGAISAIYFDDLTVRNTTIHNIGATDPGIMATLGMTLALETSLNLVNNTIVGIHGSTLSVAIAYGSADTSLFMQNNLIADIDPGTFGPYTSGACVDLGGGGSFTSGGGNVVEDNSCSTFFNDDDLKNVTTLASTLGALADNGGPVPTIALLEGSPAVDAGVTVSGLTTDARGESRLQGLAYDAGAYESSFTGNPGGNNAVSDSNGTGAGTLAQTGASRAALLVLSVFLIIAGLGSFTLSRRASLL